MFLGWIEQVLQTRLSWRLGVGGPPHSVTGWLNLASPSDPLAGHSHVIMLSQLEDPHEFDMFDPHNSWKTQKRLLSISTFLCLRILLKDRPRDHMVICLESELIFSMETYGHYNFDQFCSGNFWCPWDNSGLWELLFWTRRWSCSELSSGPARQKSACGNRSWFQISWPLSNELFQQVLLFPAISE
jgi:hypothetical protein